MALPSNAPLPPELAGPDEGNDVMAELVSAEPNAELSEAAQRWMVTDARSAEWAMRHVARADAELAQLQAQADEWTQRIQAWFDSAARPLLATKQRMEARLVRYALDRRAQDPRAKTLSLPSGKVATHHTKAKVEVVDAEAVLAWADDLELEEVVKVERRPLVSALRNHVHVVEQVVQARLWLTCGCITVIATEPGKDAWAKPDAPYTCRDCGPTTVGHWAPYATRLVAVDDEAKPVPGCVVAEEKITATVQAERP